jgi:hypothetical protein
LNNYILFDTAREALNAAYDYHMHNPDLETHVRIGTESRVGDYIFLLNTKQCLMGRKGKFFRYDFTTHEPVEMRGAPYYVINDIGERIVANSGIRTDHVIRGDL